MPRLTQSPNVRRKLAEMTSTLNIKIKSSFLDRDRQLIIDKDYIEFDNKDLISEPPTKFLKQDIVSFRHGVKWINGYQFVIGRIYCVDVLSSSGEAMKMRLKSLYGINKKKVTTKYSQIVNALYDNIFDHITKEYLKQFSESKEFEILGVRFTNDGLNINDKQGVIPWEDLGTKSYSTYYALFSKAKPNRYKAFEFLNDWNTGILYSVSMQILKEKGYVAE
jgi:hypothetical protein